MTLKIRYLKSGQLLLLAVFVLITGCKKLDLAPRDRYSELTFWQNASNVNSNLNDVYHWLYQDGYVLFNDGLSDNAFRRGTDETTISSGNFTVSNNRFASEWKNYFSAIKACNVFLANVDKNTTLAEGIINRMKGEVRFIRAWQHFHLMNWWGDVPIVDKDISVDEAKKIPRSSKGEVVNFIVSELDAVVDLLPKKDGYAAEDRGRITRGAALALKARVLLYQGDRMNEVAAICEQLMNAQGQNGFYTLEKNYSDLFSDAVINKASDEPILSLQFTPVLRTWTELFDMVPLSAGARTNGLAPTQELVDSYIMLNGRKITDVGSGYDIDNPYTNRDPRLAATVVFDKYNWVNSDGSTQVIYIRPGTTPQGGNGANEYSNSGQGSATGYYWRKYWDPNYTMPQMASGLNLHLIRYTDVLLMYAEAKESLGEFSADIWNQTIRKIRERAGFTQAGALDYPAGSNIRDVIRNERRAEFVLEGLRIDDIRRWRIADSVMNGWIHGARFSGDLSTDNGFIRVQERIFDPSKHYLWPVPPSELELNKNIEQNPNY